MKKGQTERKFPVGAELLDDGVHFRVWADRCRSLAIEYGSDRKKLTLTDEKNGYFSGMLPGADAQHVTYKIFLPDEGISIPDPVSRFQPEGPHGVSQVIDPKKFCWSDHEWKCFPKEDLVLYEMHIGTFSKEGTWDGATSQLRHLFELGITGIELMPINECPGKFNWGYDGVGMFAPNHNYGSPEDAKRFIDTAHGLGIAVILDVVYNHFGPDGCHLKTLCNNFFHRERSTDWGDAINFDGDASSGVREFFITNALYWLDEYHFDGFRFDATQNIYDESDQHILGEIVSRSRALFPDRQLFMVGENEPQDCRLLESNTERGFGFDMVWNDDFHHTARVTLTGRKEGYLCDYNGSSQELLSAVKWGYLFQGQFYAWQQKRRGTSPTGFPSTSFIHFIQNHDQIANCGNGYRIHELCAGASLRAMTGLLLLSPQIPMLFQGQEFNATSRFFYFGDHKDDLAKGMAQGRKNETAQFLSFMNQEMLDTLPVPSDEKTFLRSKINLEEIDAEKQQQARLLHTDLLQLRKTDPALIKGRYQQTVEGAVIGPECFLLKYSCGLESRLLIVNFGKDLNLPSIPEPLFAAPANNRWQLVWSSESPRYGGLGTAELEHLNEDGTKITVTITAQSTQLFKPVMISRSDQETEQHRSDRHEENKKKMRMKVIHEG